MFIGFQPGGDERHLRKEDQQGWPPVCEYAVSGWPLAHKLQDIFGVEVLKECVGVNSIFFRAPLWLLTGSWIATFGNA